MDKPPHPSSLKLSAAKRALLEALLRDENLSLDAAQRISPRNRSEPAPLSFAQEGLWFLHQLDRTGSTYNVPLTFVLKGRLEVEALEWGLNQVIQRHEILRTTVGVIAGQACQVIAPELAVSIRRIDLRFLPESQRQPEMLRKAIEEARKPFDLAHGPLLRVTLIQVEEEKFFLVLCLHHLVFDEWSQEVLFREWSQFHQAYLTGMPASLPDMPIQYADYVVWQRGRLQHEVHQAQLSYWKEKLASAPKVLTLPLDHLRTASLSFRGAFQRRQLPSNLVEGLRRLAQSEGTTLFMAYLAAYQVLLFETSRQEDILIGTPMANRQRPELENLIGYLLNTLVLRANLSGDPDFRQVLKRVRQTVLEAFEHQDLPFDQLVRELKPQRDPSRHPLFQVAFVLLPATLQRLQLSGLEAQSMRLDYGWSKFDLTLFMIESDSGMTAGLEYCVDLFDPSTIERLLDRFLALLEVLLANPDHPISVITSSS